MKFQECIEDYLNHIRHERNLAKSTCLHYGSWLNAYTEWLSVNSFNNPDIQDVFTVALLRKYQYAKAKAGVQPRTIHSAFHALRGLGEFLLANGLISENPCKKLTMPKKGAANRHTLTDADVAALFEAARRQRSPVSGL